jgi:hypothetical protein
MKQTLCVKCQLPRGHDKVDVFAIIEETGIIRQECQSLPCYTCLRNQKFNTERMIFGNGKKTARTQVFF